MQSTARLRMHKSLHNQTPKAVYLQSKPLLFHCIRNRHKTNKQQFLHLNEKTLEYEAQRQPCIVYQQKYLRSNIIHGYSQNTTC